MKRSAGALVLVVALGGCMSVDRGAGKGAAGPGGPGGCQGCFGQARAPMAVPGVQGAWGQSVPMIPPYTANPPGAMAARSMMARNVPLDLVQASASSYPGTSSGLMQTNASCPPGGCPSGMVGPPGGILSPPGVPGFPGL